MQKATVGQATDATAEDDTGTGALHPPTPAGAVVVGLVPVRSPGHCDKRGPVRPVGAPLA
jgi:hypothetical protein